MSTPLEDLTAMLTEMRQEHFVIMLKIVAEYTAIDEYIDKHGSHKNGEVLPFLRARAASIARLRSYQIPLGYAIDKAEAAFIEVCSIPTEGDLQS